MSGEREAVITYDPQMLVYVAVVLVGLIVAVYALAAGPGPNPSEFAAAVVYP